MWVALLPAAYLLGTFPSAALVARANGIDITRRRIRQPGRLERHARARLAQGRLGLRARRR